MRHRFAILLTCLSLLIFLMSLLLTATTGAQDGSPVPTLTPESATTLVTVDNAAAVTALPFSDTFDTSTIWKPTGVWRYGLETGYGGGGWMIDSTQTPSVSTLEYPRPLDLFGTLGALLVFRQRGNLPTSDLIAVDISLDGGEAWLSVDQQIGIDAAWEQRFVDLTPFQGQVILLRFRVSVGVRPAADPASAEALTAELPEDADAASDIPEGFWIDNVTIQYVDWSSLAYEIEGIGEHAHMGLHLVVGAQQQPVVDLAKRMVDLGWPLNTLKGTTDTENILNAVAAVSPDTVIVYRSLLTPWGMLDCPNAGNDPVAEANEWVYGLQPYWREVDADYYEVMNECQPPAEWLVQFTIEAMRIANSLGECLLVFSFAPGNPELDYFAQLTPVFDYAVQNPCGPDRYHGVALHAYGVKRGSLVSESGLYLGLRHRLLYTQLLSENPEYGRIPVYLTEVGPGDGSTEFSCADVVRDVIQYTRQLESDPYVRGFHLWNVGKVGQWFDVTPCLPAISDALAGYYAAKPREP